MEYALIPHWFSNYLCHWSIYLETKEDCIGWYRWNDSPTFITGREFKENQTWYNGTYIAS